MFDVTYLGHQGWLVESRTTRVLVDPLLGSGLGNMPDDGFDVFPPRHIDLAAFPSVDAVIATHEHADHLSIPSLLRLDRRVPVHVPARISAAARGLVRELGFPLVLLRSNEVATVGDLEVHPFPTGEATRDEWDVMPVLVRDRGGDGSFATSIDAVESPAFARFALERAARLGVWASSHNHMDLFSVQVGGRQENDRELTPKLTRAFSDRFERNFVDRPRPEILAVLASGFSYRGDLAWMNRHVFPGSPDVIAAALGSNLKIRARAPLPGDRFSFERGTLSGESRGRPFLSTLDRAEWPAHAAERFEGSLPDFEPACGTRDFSDANLSALLAGLRGFAEYLYGGDVFRTLCAGSDEPFAGKRAAVGFGVRTPNGMLILAYRPEACAFERIEGDDPEAELVAGMTCWASDLLAIVRFELFSGYMLLGRYRKWNVSSDKLRCDLDGDLAMYTHPLRHPDQVLQLYRYTARALSETVGSARVPARS